MMIQYNLVDVMKKHNNEKGQRRIYFSFLIDLFDENLNPADRKNIILDAFKHFGIREIIFVHEYDNFHETNFPLLLLFRCIKSSSALLSFRVDWTKGRLIFEFE